MSEEKPPLEPKQVLTVPENQWSEARFWKWVNKLAEDQAIGLRAMEHPMMIAADHGAIEPDLAADSLLHLVFSNIVFNSPPAGNA